MLTLSPWFLYVILRIDAFKSLILNLNIISWTLLVVYAIIYLIIFVLDKDNNTEKYTSSDYKKCTKTIGKLSLIPITFAMLNVFMPTRNETIALVFVPKILNSETCQTDVPNIINNVMESVADYFEPESEVANQNTK